MSSGSQALAQACTQLVDVIERQQVGVHPTQLARTKQRLHRVRGQGAQLGLVDHLEAIEADLLAIELPVDVALDQQAQIGQALGKAGGRLHVVVEGQQELLQAGQVRRVFAFGVEQRFALLGAQAVKGLVHAQGHFVVAWLLCQHEGVAAHEGGHVSVLSPVALCVDQQVFLVAQAHDGHQGVGVARGHEDAGVVQGGQRQLAGGQQHRIGFAGKAQVLAAVAHAQLAMLVAVDGHDAFVHQECFHGAVDQKRVPEHGARRIVRVDDSSVPADTSSWGEPR